MKKTRCFMTVWVALWLLWPMVFNAMAQQSVEVINYQGELNDLSGPLNGEVEMTFEIFDIEEPGASDKPLWFETQTFVEVSQGIFDVKLGQQNPFSADLFDRNDDLFLRVTVNGEALRPLQHITSVPYALKADTANHAYTATSADSILTGTVTGDLQVDGRIGVGSADPVAKFHVMMPEGGSIPSLVPGMIIEDALSNLGSRLEIRDENGNAEFSVDGSGDVLVGGNGKMGIGTSSPDAKLHLVMPSGMPGIPPTASTVKGLIITDGLWNAGNQFEIQDDAGNPRLVVNTGGQVGIGTADPQTPLEVQGVVSIDGALGIGTTSPGAAMEISGNGNDDESGFLYIRNGYPQSTGIRFLDGHGVTHHIYSGEPSDVLRIRPNGVDATNGGITITQAGNVGIGAGYWSMSGKLTVRGNVTLLSESTGNLIMELGEGLDYAEGFDVTEEMLEPGTVLAIDDENPGHLTTCKTAYDRKVAGIVAGANGLGSGVRLGGKQFDQDVALAGRVYCKVETTNTGILSGDLLTTSTMPGHAMKVVDYTRAQGAVLGKAMEPLEKGKKGLILVLITLQ